MSDMDGFEALENAQDKKLLNEKTILIVLSNQTDKIAQEKALKLGANKFIVKSSLLPEEIAKEVIEIYQEQIK
jgi:CheY-like chemotaxis protein